MKALQLAVALALLGAAAAAPALGRNAAEFSPSIVLTNMGEMGQPCHQMVQRAIATNAKSIKFVPTVHYYGSETHIDRFCLRDEYWACQDINSGLLTKYTDLLASCMKKAVDAGVGIAVLAHLDNMKEYTWRNVLQFSPTAKYNGYSYADVVLKPMATAVNKAIRPGTEVIFTLQGETGKSISQYSKQWLELVGKVKGWIKEGKNLNNKDVLVGISLNYNKIYGWFTFDSISPQYISQTLDKEWKTQVAKYPIDLVNFRKLYDAIDIIGVSAYPPLDPNFTPADLEITLKYHDQELKYAGVDLKGLLNKGKRLVISEWGIGGGTMDGSKIAANLADVAGYPFFGLWYPYATNKDPWRNPQFNAYRRKLYSATSDWLKKKGGPTYRVDGLYVWNAGSWDATGVHFATAGNGGSWQDGQITEMVKAHNKAVNQATATAGR